MTLNKFLQTKLFFTTRALSLASILCAPSARANIYATNIKLNGGLTNITSSQGSSVNISYILNEPASLGVVINVLSGTTPVRTIVVTAGNPGTLRGTNLVVWDGKNTLGVNVPVGTYKVSITPASSGYTNWTQISRDSDAGNYLFSPRGVAVNVNTNSPYYGRIFAGNAKKGPNPLTVPGDADGIVKLNSDGSFADEGQSTAGYAWIDDGFNDSPHQLRYGMDDRIYALDWTGPGIIVACDMIMSTNEVVLPVHNYSSNPYYGTVTTGNGWSVMDVTDADTDHGRLWLADNDFPSAGVWVWLMTNGVADTNDTVGTQAVATGGDVSLVPQGGLVVDDTNNIYVAQGRSGYGQSANRVVCFTNWDGSTPESTGAAWVAGSLDDTFRAGYDLAIDSRSKPNYIAAPLGISSSPAGPGGIRILSATNGSIVVSNLDGGNFYYGASFDNVGNLYGVTSTNGLPSLSITSIAVSNATVTLNFTNAALPSSAFTLLSSSVVTGPYAAAAGATITQGSPGTFTATVPTSGSSYFYRLARATFFHGLRVFSPPSGVNQATTVAVKTIQVQ